MPFKLIISNRVEFDVRFTLNDAGEAKAFGLRLSADRSLIDEIKADHSEELNIGEFLRKRNVTMLAWIGKAALEDAETGHPVPPGEEALQGLMGLVSGMAQLIYVAYLDANGARGKAGN